MHGGLETGHVLIIYKCNKVSKKYMERIERIFTYIIAATTYIIGACILLWILYVIGAAITNTVCNGCLT